jgi:hypothetical protein
MSDEQMTPEELAQWREATGRAIGMGQPSTQAPSLPSQGPAGNPPPGTPANWIDPSGWWWSGEMWHPPLARPSYVPPAMPYPPAPKAKAKHPPAVIGFAVLVAIAVGIWLFTMHSSPPSSADISKIAAVNSDCANYSTLDKPGKDLCDTQVANVRSVCNGDDLDRGSFINNNTGGVAQAEAELTALCPEKAHQ